MKKLPFATLSLCLLLFACSKKDSSAPNPVSEGKKIAVKFSANDFIQKFEQLPSARIGENNGLARDSALADKISNLYFLIFKADSIVRLVSQRATDPNFGTFTDSLVQGNYTVSVLGSKDSLPVRAARTISFSRNGKPTAYPDFFQMISDIKVSPDSTNSFNINLFRRVTSLQVEIQDSLNQVADSTITVAIKEQSIYNLLTGAPSQGADSLFYLPKKSRNVFNAFYVNQYSTVTVVISYPSRTNPGQRLIRAISNVSFKPNTKVILTGYLYGGNPGIPGKSGFNVSVYDIWGPTEVTHF